jgi:hypothetical protein
MSMKKHNIGVGLLLFSVILCVGNACLSTTLSGCLGWATAAIFAIHNLLLQKINHDEN